MDLWDEIDDESAIDTALSQDDVTIKDLLAIPEFLQEISDLNENLMEYLSTVDRWIELVQFIKNPSGDEIEFYKFPHVAAEAFKCYPAKKVSKIAKSSLFDVIFDILNLPCPMENRIAEYFAVMLSVFVEHAPKETYKYVSEHSETIIKGLYKHFNCVGMVDAFRFLLDLPIAKGSSEPWWHTSSAIIDPLVDCLKNPLMNMSKYTMLFVNSIIQRATVSVPGEPERTSVSLLPVLCSVEFVQKLFTIIEDKEVCEHCKRDTFKILSRMFWKKLPDVEYGLGGEDGCLHTLGLDDRLRLQQGTISKELLVPVMEELAKHYDSIFALLCIEPETTVPTPYHPAVKRCGDLRLSIFECFAHYISNPFMLPALIQQFIEKKFVSTMLSICVAFPRCSYIHVHMRSILNTLLDHKECLVQVLVKDQGLVVIKKAIEALEKEQYHTSLLGILYEYIHTLHDAHVLDTESTEVYKAIEETVYPKTVTILEKLFDTSIFSSSPMPNEENGEGEKIPEMKDEDDFDAPEPAVEKKAKKITKKSSTKKSSKKTKKEDEDDFGDADFDDFEENPAPKKEKKEKKAKKTTKKAEAKKEDDDFGDADFDDFEEEPAPKKEKKAKKTTKKTTKKAEAKKEEDDFGDADFDDF